MKKTVKLNLHRETLRLLAKAELEQPVGGTVPTHFCIVSRNGYTCQTIYC